MRSRPRFHFHGKNGACRRGNIRGFTLIEVLLASFSGALVLAVIYGVFTGAVRTRDKATIRAHEAQLRQRASLVIRNDLENAYISGGTLGAVLEGSEKGPESHFPGLLRFTTTTGRDSADQLRGDVQQVSYYVVEDPDNPNNETGMLVRAVDRTLLARVREDDREDELLREVTSFEVAFYDGSAWSNTWNYTPGSSGSLPKAVRVNIVQAPSSEKIPQPAPLEIYVPWTAQPLTTGTSSTSTSGVPSTASAAPSTATGPTIGGDADAEDEEDNLSVPDQQEGEIAGMLGVSEGDEGEEDTSAAGGATP